MLARGGRLLCSPLCVKMSTKSQPGRLKHPLSDFGRDLNTSIYSTNSGHTAGSGPPPSAVYPLLTHLKAICELLVKSLEQHIGVRPLLFNSSKQA